MNKPLRVIISGGGTGGHIFPAIAIADAIKKRFPQSEILFVGAENRMEMKRVPAAGYQIEGLPVSGFNRSNLLKNISVIKMLFASLLKAKQIIKKFQPDAVIGVGGYASGPILKIASNKKIPTIIQEQNSYAGLTNKLLSKRVDKICVAYTEMDRFFPKSKIVITGNPFRQDLINSISKAEAYRHFGLDPHMKTILVLGGSLGSRTINQSIVLQLHLLENQPVQLIWQCGSNYLYENSILLQNKFNKKQNIQLYDFIDRMDYAYKVADLVISRAGASSISELSVLRKPVILVPSPNVAEDHQTKNAQALVEKNAAIIIPDDESVGVLLSKALRLVNNKPLLDQLADNISQFAQYNAADKIVDEVVKLVYYN